MPGYLFEEIQYNYSKEKNTIINCFPLWLLLPSKVRMKFIQPEMYAHGWKYKLCTFNINSNCFVCFLRKVNLNHTFWKKNLSWPGFLSKSMILSCAYLEVVISKRFRGIRTPCSTCTEHQIIWHGKFQFNATQCLLKILYSFLISFLIVYLRNKGVKQRSVN